MLFINEIGLRKDCQVRLSPDNNIISLRNELTDRTPVTDIRPFLLQNITPDWQSIIMEKIKNNYGLMSIRNRILIFSVLVT
ncbi:MAG: hypothetical protein KKC77_13700, partial [Proteobacteria bacterium]|nr:hypothetical protein [Pseudomonadota bacterium]